MASTSKTNGGTEQKWDWDVIEALYLGGMELSQIVEVPRYSELSLNYLRKRASEKGWKDKRHSARVEGTGEIARPLIQKMGIAEETHQHWVLDRLAEERKIFDDHRSQKGGKDQMERLQIIKQIDDAARRTLGLDDKKPLSDQQRNLGILIAINSGGGPRLKGNEQSVTVTIQEQDAPKQLQDPVLAAKVLEVLEEAREEEQAPRPFRIKGEAPLVNESPRPENEGEAGA